MASYEEDAPNLVNDLVPELRPEEQRRNTSKMEENKTTADRRHQIEIKDEEDNLE